MMAARFIREAFRSFTAASYLHINIAIFGWVVLLYCLGMVAVFSVLCYRMPVCSRNSHASTGALIGISADVFFTICLLHLLYRMIVELHRKVSSLIEFLKQKWALHEVRIVSFSSLVCSVCLGMGPVPFL